MPPELVQLGLGLLVLGLLFGAWIYRGASAASFGYWPFAWAILAAEGVVRVATDTSPTVHLTGALLSVFLLAGAYRYVGLALPRWLVPAGVALGIADQVLALSGNPELAFAIGFVAELGMMIAAGVVVIRFAETQAGSRVHALLPVTFFAIAAVDVYDFFFLTEGADAIQPWLLVSVPCATIQILANLERTRLRADVAESKLERSVSLLRATLESTADGIFVVDQNGHCTSFNRMFGEMWQIPDSVLESRDSELSFSFAAPQLKDPDAFYEKVRALDADSEAESFDTLEFKDGRVFERYSRPQRVGDEVVGRVWSFCDVTERKRAEQMAKRYQDHLEDLVQERTRELLESRDQLLNADRLAAVGTLAAGVAHQINNPVGSILNSAEYALLCESDDDVIATWKRALEVNAHEARRCAAIVRSMLQFARAEPVARRVEDLNRVIQRAARAVASYAHERNARLDIVLDDDPLWVEMSPIEVEQVVVNLLRNAIESLEFSGNISARAVRKPNDAAEGKSDVVDVHVVDDGRGISPDHAGRIFDPFFSTRVHEGGTGLGLSVAHGIVTGHGGEIAVDSRPGGGTCITITLPLRDDPETEVPDAQGVTIAA